MTRYTRLLHHVLHLAGTLLTLLVDVVRFLRLCLHPAPGLAAENLFLRKQLAFYQERHVTPRRATEVLFSSLVCWRAGWTGARLSHGAASNLYPLASPGVLSVLAQEIQAWTPADPSGPASPHPPDRAGEPVVG